MIADMSISIPKTKCQLITKKSKVTATTEKDIANLPPNLQFNHKCDKCDRSFPTKHGLSLHKGRWCKWKRRKKQPSRMGTVADRVVQQHKVDESQKTLDHVKIGNNELENHSAISVRKYLEMVTIESQ